jgi:very-short-patch-repair endonuclease
MQKMSEYICQLPSCGKVIPLPTSIAKTRKYCSKECSHIHQKETGIRKNNKNNSLETLVKLYGEEEGTNRHNAFRKKISEYVKETPIKNQSFIRSDELRERISQTRKETNRKRKMKLAESFIEEDAIKRIEYDQLYGDGKYDALKKSMKGVFTLDWFIGKYGENEGSDKYKERCENIKKTTHFKTYNSTNKSNISKISQRLFNILYEDKSLNLKSEKVYYQELNHEHACSTGRNFDFVVLNRKKIIEFNGDKFHANPTIYKPNDNPNPYLPDLKASQIWTDDANKNQTAKDNGFDVLVIWETEFKNNELNTIEKCKQFLKN